MKEDGWDPSKCVRWHHLYPSFLLVIFCVLLSTSFRSVVFLSLAFICTPITHILFLGCRYILSYTQPLTALMKPFYQKFLLSISLFRCVPVEVTAGSFCLTLRYHFFSLLHSRRCCLCSLSSHGSSALGLLVLWLYIGSIVIFHGNLLHYSHPNTSDASREAFTLHMIDGVCEYPSDNW